MKLSPSCVVGLASLVACGAGVVARGAIQFEESQALALADTAPGVMRSTSGVSTTPALAFDNRPETSWKATVKQGESVWLEYEFAGGVRWRLSGYQLTSGSTGSDFDPREWTLQASNDGQTWATLDQRISGPFPRRRFTGSYSLSATEAYSRYRFLFSAPQGDRRIELGEVGLFVKTHALPPNAFSAETERGGVVLRWDAAADAEAYTVLRAPEAGGPYVVIASGIAANTFLDKGPYGGAETSFYAVASEREGRPGAPVVTSGVLTPVSAPSGVTLKRGDGTVVLEWSPVPRAAAYVVRRSLQKEGPYTTVGSQITAPAFTDQGLNAGTAYYYVVCGVANGKEGVESEPVSALFPPAAPSGLKADPAKEAVSLAWNAVALAKSYQVLRATAPDQPREFLAEVKEGTTFFDRAVSVGRVYHYAVVAVNECGTSVESAVVTGGPEKPSSWWRR